MPTEKDKIINTISSLVDRTDLSLKYYVNEYEVDRAYGGPEEGGWWYDTGRFIRCYGAFNSRAQAIKRKAELYSYVKNSNNGKHSPSSVLSRGDWIDIIIEEHEGKHFPERTPKYE